MTHKRNTAGLANAAKLRREETILRVNNAINGLIKQKQAVNFNAVSKMAVVGKTWLYNEIEVRDRILSLRKKRITDIQKNGPADEINVSCKSSLIVMLKNRIKELEVENKVLKKQIEVIYGQLTCK